MRGTKHAWVMGVLAVIGMMATAGWGEVTKTGDTYDYLSSLYAGNHANAIGGLTVDAGSGFFCQNGYLGCATGSTGAATVSGAGSWWNCFGNYFYVGYNGTGTLRVEDGGRVGSGFSGYLGYNAGSTGEAVITGAGSKWDNFKLLWVGYSGSGTLRVEAGAQVSSSGGELGFSSGSTGAAIITGTGSKWTNSGGLGVGSNGTGTLRVEDGGQVSSYGGDVGSGSTAIITGAGSRWITDSYGLFVGGSDGGTLRVELGGQVSSATGTLGFRSGSGMVTISGAGSKWTNSHVLFVGEDGSGTLGVEAGGQVSSALGYLGDISNSMGTAIITGAGSKWTNSRELYVGYNGRGSLEVSNGGLVSTKTLYASLSDLYGNGTITVQGGVVLDAELVFDATHGLAQTLAFGSGGTLQFTIDGTGDLGVGHKRSGSLRIAESCSVTSASGYLGYKAGSTGTAIITGAGTKWASSGNLNIGYAGSGTLRVEAGGQISNGDGYLGYYSGSTGTAVITGSGSKWTNSGSLYVGYHVFVGYSSGSLTVSDGGQVTARSLGIYNSQSIVRLHVSGDRMLVLGDDSAAGSVRNDGKLSLLADAFLPGGTYRPIGEYADRAVSWSGGGSTVAVGGVWDGGAGTFTVSDPVFVEAGVAAEVGGGMRVVIGDDQARVGVSLGELSSGGELTGWALTEEERAGLLAGLGEGERIAGAWEFEGQLAGGEVLVSMEAGVGAEEVRVWRWVEGQWSEYRPEMLTYDGKGVVSFTVEAGSLCAGAYAVSVPEPGVMSVLVMGVGMMVRGRRWRRRGGEGRCAAG